MEYPFVKPHKSDNDENKIVIISGNEAAIRSTIKDSDKVTSKALQYFNAKKAKSKGGI